MDLHKKINKLVRRTRQRGHRRRERVGTAAAGPPASGRLHARPEPHGVLKFDHPGLDTAATRDGERLLIQNDIGTNDAHVLVIQVAAHSITLTYSDLHRVRLEFFQAIAGAIRRQMVWAGVAHERRTQPGCGLLGRHSAIRLRR
jgi:hypothetical protein